MKKIASKLCCWVLVCAMLLAQLLIPMPLRAQAADTVRAADTQVQAGTTLHCWNWSYANIIANLPTIAAQGFTSIQVSPIQQAKQPTMGGPVNDWWAFYQPADFAIDNTGVNAMGTKADFMNLCETAHEYGIYVIVDVVANHMAADYNYSRSPAIIEDIRNDNSCWHNKNSNINNYSSRENITQYDLDSVLDLNTGSDKVQTYVLNYLKELIDAGADGFRFDAVKHIETPDDNASFASDFWPTVVYGAEEYAEAKGLDLYCYGELLDHPDDVNGLPDSAYTKYYSITDNVWGNNVRDTVVAGGNASAFTSTYHKNVSADQLVLWAESHDTYAGGNSGSVSEANINKTWALVAARADAMGLYLTRTTGFTPPNALGDAYLSGWNTTEVAAVNKFHKAFAGQSEYLANSGSIAYVERGTSGAVLVNVGGNGTSVSVPANKLASGTYKDQISGNTFTVSGGKITGTIGSSGIAVIYNVASCSHSSHNIAGLCSNCGASVSHSYSGGTCACGKTEPITSGCTHTAHRYNGVCRGCGATVGHSYESGICTVCGVEQPKDTFAYYLTGYINGSNVSEVNESYRFTDGKLVFTSSVDAYVAIRTYNGIYYQTTSAQQYKDTVTLHNASMSGDNSQMRVPGGQTVTLQLQSNYNGTYTLSYAEGGIVTPSGSASDYYLVGYINGANHGCEEDNANLGNYKFENGKLTATFTQDSYVFVKNGDNSKWLLADSYCTDTTCTFSEGKTEKMLVPGGVEVTFTLTENADGSVTVSYTTSGSDSGDTTTRTIYFDNSGTNWSNVNGYSWNASGATTGEWPGSAMTLVEGSIYSYEVPTSATSIIFNDGSSQTDDLTIPTDSKNLFLSATSSWGTYTPAEVTTKTIYVDITGFDWTNVNVYTWDAVGTATTGAWPGSAMTKVEDNIYSYEVPSNAVNIIFNNGTEQTNDLTIPTDGSDLYNYKQNSWSTYAQECSHSYTSKITLAASCTQNGLRTYTCSLCGLAYTESIPATGHSYTAKVTTAATCEAAGVKTYTCSKCGDSYTESIAATGHNYVSGTCTVCGESDGTVTPTTVTIYFDAAGTGWTNVNVYTWDAAGTATTGQWPGSAMTLVEGTVYSYEVPLDAVNIIFNNGSSQTSDLTIPTDGKNLYTYSTSSWSTYGTGGEVVDPVATTYYLVGYINGADYGCEGDYANMGDYKFVDGKLTATFETDSYIFVKTEGNGKWLMANAYCTDTTCTFVEGGSEKMKVPGGVALTFTLTENADGSVTVSYVTAAASTVPTLSLSFPTLTFEDMISMNVYFTATDITDVVEMGMITYSSSASSYSIDTAEKVIPGYTWSDTYQMYVITTGAIAAKDMSDVIYFAAYAKLADGTYAYSRLVSYSPTSYAYDQLSSASDSLKQLMIAMLNYGAEAQTFFNYRTDALMNASLTAAQKASIESYRSDMMDSVASVSTTKAANFTRTSTGFTSRYPSISFEGAFQINYYCVPSAAVKGNITLYYWNQADFDAVSVLSTSNATGAITMTQGTDRYEAAVTGIAAKDLDKGIYVAFVYSDGTSTYCSGVLGYSIGAYCVANAATTDAIAPFAQATAVYGYYAKQYFSA